VVTGASRGVGKGAALGLAAHGATVYLTGRTENDAALPEFLKGATIYKTADEVNKLGGVGIAHRCDFNNDGDIKALFARVKQEHGKLDILVNNAWSGGEHVMNGYFWNTPFWEQPIAMFDGMYAVGLRSGYVCSQYAAKMMTAQKSGTIVNISFQCAKEYFINPVHGIIKAGVDKMTADTAHELKEYGVKVFSLYPGAVATEGMLEMAKYDAAMDINQMESPRFIGECVASLASDDAYLNDSGKVMLTKSFR